MDAIQVSAKVLQGVSFSIAELVLIKSWSEANGLNMVVRLDHSSDVEDYEEVLAFHLGNSPLCRWIMWRNAGSVFIQPLIGRTRCFGSAAAAFKAMASGQQVVLTDIKPAGWPA